MRCIIKKVKQGSAALKERWNRLTPGKRTAAGITVIELVLILVIVIALLLIFKNQLIDLINTIFDKIVSESSGI